MTIVYPRTFQRMKPAGHDGVFDWDFLKPAWQHDRTRIEPMDIDAVVERYGHFLGFETKDDGVPIKAGQRIALEALARHPNWRIVLVRAKHPKDIREFEVWSGDEKITVPGDADRLVRYCARWFHRVSMVGQSPACWRAGAVDLFHHQMTPMEQALHLFRERMLPVEQEAFVDEILGCGP